MLLLATPSGAEEASEACKGLVPRLDRLVDRYYRAGEEAIQKEDPGPAMDRARKAAIAGDPGATIRMIGIGMVLRGRTYAVTVEAIRQICTYSERNGQPLHIAACAYLNALNPLGDRVEKRKLVEAALARFERAEAEKGGNDFAEDMKALRGCLSG